MDDSIYLISFCMLEVTVLLSLLFKMKEITRMYNEFTRMYNESFANNLRVRIDHRRSFRNALNNIVLILKSILLMISMVIFDILGYPETAREMFHVFVVDQVIHMQWQLRLRFKPTAKYKFGSHKAFRNNTFIHTSLWKDCFGHIDFVLFWRQTWAQYVRWVVTFE